MHGGAPGSGAPLGNRNALKHGQYTRKAIEERRMVQNFLRESRLLYNGSVDWNEASTSHLLLHRFCVADEIGAIGSEATA
jgi:hypothetical protein